MSTPFLHQKTNNMLRKIDKMLLSIGKEKRFLEMSKVVGRCFMRIHMNESIHCFDIILSNI